MSRTLYLKIIAILDFVLRVFCYEFQNVGRSSPSLMLLWGVVGPVGLLRPQCPQKDHDVQVKTQNWWGFFDSF